MGITMNETPRSRRGTTDQRELIYNLCGTSSESTARSTVESSAPATFDDLERQDPDIDLDPLWVDSVAGDGQWLVTVPYGKLAPRETGDSVYNWQVGVEQLHITQGLTDHDANAGNYVASGTAPNYKGAIGVTDDGVEGTYTLAPTFQWSETHYLAAATVDQDYQNAVADLAGCTNDDTFRGFAAGEVVFMGCSGTQRSQADHEVSFHFARRPNRTNVTVGDITVSTLEGWEYLWVRYEKTIDQDKLIQRAVSAHVEQVLYEGDFDGLEI